MSEKIKKENTKNIWPLLNTVLIMMLGGLCLVSLQRNHVMKTKYAAGRFEEIRTLENKVMQLENMIKTHQNVNTGVDLKDMTALNEKIDNVGKINLELLESKASLASVAGVVERVDHLEQEIGKLGKVSSQGALVLTAAGLVENAAKKREPFVYEASILEQLSHDTPMEKSAQIILEIATKGLPVREDLIEKFIRLYEQNFMTTKNNDKPKEVKILPSEQKKWSENIKEKLGTLVVIEKIQEPSEINISEEKTDGVDDVYRLVRSGEFEAAILKMNANPAYQTEKFGIWIEEVRSEKVFDREMEKIKALTLGVMKTENLR